MDGGHEIINHSWSHADFAPTDGVTPAPDLAIEMDQATSVLDESLPGQKTDFFIFPYDSFDDAALSHLGALGHARARAGTKGLNSADFSDGLRVNFDVYGGENSIYQAEGDIMKYYVARAEALVRALIREATHPAR